MKHRKATLQDSPLLAKLNHQLIQDEGHRNRMSVLELEVRMRNWLMNEYQAEIFEQKGKPVAYALFRKDNDSLYLRQFFVVHDSRREGIGRKAMQILFNEVWPNEVRIIVDVLSKNEVGYKFWKVVGFRDYAITLEIFKTSRRSGPRLPRSQPYNQKCY